MNRVAYESMRAAVGESALSAPVAESRPRGAIGDVLVVTPNNREQLVAIVEAARRDCLALVPIGTGRRARVMKSERPAVYVNMLRLNKVVAHEVGDLTLTVECGASLNTILQIAAAKKQFVALDVAHSDATLGGTLATAEEGSLAGRYGPVRDQILGISVVNGDAAATKAGGRVVKNVTGYDLVRLYTGSLGSLAILAEATLRLRPLPETSRAVVAPMGSWSDAVDAAAVLRREILDLTTLHIISGDAAVAAGLDPVVPAWVRCGLTGFSQSTTATISKIESKGRATWEPRPASDSGAFSLAPNHAARRIRIAANAGAWRALEPTIAPLLPPFAGRTHDVLRGVSEFWAVGQWRRASAAALDVELATAHARIELPDDPAFEQSLAVEWPSQVPDGVAFMAGIKHALDPNGVLCPQSNFYG